MDGRLVRVIFIFFSVFSFGKVLSVSRVVVFFFTPEDGVKGKHKEKKNNEVERRPQN